LLGTFVADGALDRRFLRWRQGAVFAAAPAPGARRESSDAELFIPSDRLADGRVAQPDINGDLRPGTTSLVSSNDLPPPLVLLERAELSCIVFFHQHQIHPAKRRLIYLRAESTVARARPNTGRAASLTCAQNCCFIQFSSHSGDFYSQHWFSPALPAQARSRAALDMTRLGLVQSIDPLLGPLRHPDSLKLELQRVPRPVHCVISLGHHWFSTTDS
jgi:hypothetical protein